MSQSERVVAGADLSSLSVHNLKDIVLASAVWHSFIHLYCRYGDILLFSAVRSHHY